MKYRSGQTFYPSPIIRVALRGVQHQGFRCENYVQRRTPSREANRIDLQRKKKRSLEALRRRGSELLLPHGRGFSDRALRRRELSPEPCGDRRPRRPRQRDVCQRHILNCGLHPFPFEGDFPPASVKRIKTFPILLYTFSMNSSGVILFVFTAYSQSA